MADIGIEHAGILILRAWAEERAGDRLCVRVIQVRDARESPVAGAATPDDVCEVVRRWLAALPTNSRASKATECPRPGR